MGSHINESANTIQLKVWDLDKLQRANVANFCKKWMRAKSRLMVRNVLRFVLLSGKRWWKRNREIRINTMLALVWTSWWCFWSSDCCSYWGVVISEETREKEEKKNRLWLRKGSTRNWRTSWMIHQLSAGEHRKYAERLAWNCFQLLSKLRG